MNKVGGELEVGDVDNGGGVDCVIEGGGGDGICCGDGGVVDVSRRVTAAAVGDGGELDTELGVVGVGKSGEPLLGGIDTAADMPVKAVTEAELRLELELEEEPAVGKGAENPLQVPVVYQLTVKALSG